MKLFLLTLSVLFFNDILGQVINPEFDDWEVIQMGQPYENPIGWTTNNETDENGFASTPVTKGTDSSGYYARVTSNAHGIDATFSGLLSQTISAINLVEIEFVSKCDTLAMAGKCIVRVLDQSKSTVLFEDTSFTVSNKFSQSTIDIISNWTIENDSITIQFIAKGGIDPWDKQEDGYSVFMIDKVRTEYITSTEDGRHDLEFAIYPNPANDLVHIVSNLSQPTSKMEILTLTGRPILRTRYSTWLKVDWIPNGVYIFNLITEKSMRSSLLVINR
jgi:hypothetical protein